MKNPIHPSVDFVLNKLNQAKFFLGNQSHASAPLDSTFRFPTIITDLRGAARYVMASEGNSTAAALLIMTAGDLKRVNDSTGYTGFALEMRNEIQQLLESSDDLVMANMSSAKLNEADDGRLDNYFGLCPECGTTDGFLNIRSNHFFVCDDCKTAWCVGSNLFSAWKEEDESVWEKNEAKLADYRMVEPIYDHKKAARHHPAVKEEDPDFIF